MPNELERSISDLVYFLNGRWSGNLSRLSAGSETSRLNRLFAQASLLDSYLWLRLGVLHNCFSEDVASRVVKEHSSLLNGSWKEFARAGHDRLFRDDVRDTLEFVELRKPSGLGRLSQVNRETITVFRNYLLVSDDFDADPEAPALIESISFANVADWEKTMAAVRPRSRVDLTQPRERERWENDAVRRSDLTAGFVAVVQHMQSVYELTEDVRTNSSVPPSEFLGPQSWRLNFRDKGIRDRFEQIARSIISCMMEASAPEPHPLAQSGELALNEDIRPLMTLWGAPPLLFHVAGS